VSTTAVLGMAVGQRVGAAGHARLATDWLIGLRAIGLRPLLIDWIDPAWGDAGPAVAWIARIMDEAGLADAWTVLSPEGVLGGLDAARVADHVRGAVVIDVMGYLADRVGPVLDGAAARAYLDIDPGFGQLWTALGWTEPRTGYDAWLTVGLAAGTSRWQVPDDGHPWVPLPPPVDLARWQTADVPSGPITTVATWRGPYDPIEWNGRRLGLRAHAMRPLVELASRHPGPFELVLDIDPADRADRDRLEGAGWRLHTPELVATPDAYRAFITGSRAELCVAKELYQALGTGWFSDRSACYLAAGRPVLMSDTGVGEGLPVGEGLLTFADLDDALAALGAIDADPAAHAEAARAIARDHLDAALVARRAVEVTLGSGHR